MSSWDILGSKSAFGDLWSVIHVGSVFGCSFPWGCLRHLLGRRARSRIDFVIRTHRRNLLRYLTSITSATGTRSYLWLDDAIGLRRGTLVSIMVSIKATGLRCISRIIDDKPVNRHSQGWYLAMGFSPFFFVRKIVLGSCWILWTATIFAFPCWLGISHRSCSRRGGDTAYRSPPRPALGCLAQVEHQ